MKTYTFNNPEIRKKATENSAKARKNTTPCKIEGCEKPNRSRQMCAAHYQAWRVKRNKDEKDTPLKEL